MTDTFLALESMCLTVFSKVLTRFLKNLHAEFDGKENIESSQIDAVFNATLKNLNEEIKKNRRINRYS